MPNSDQTATRDQIVRGALRKLGNHNPSSTEVANGALSLNLLIKMIDSEGKWLWAISNTESTLTLSASTASYSTGSGAANIATDILQLETFALYIGSEHRFLDIISKEESLRTYLKDDSGEPLAVYLERLPDPDNNKLWVYPTPSGTYTAKYTYRRRLYDFDSASDTPDFPQGWEIPLQFRLAAELSHEYGIPLQERDYLQGMGDRLVKERKAQNADNYTAPRQRVEFF